MKKTSAKKLPEIPPITDEERKQFGEKLTAAQRAYLLGNMINERRKYSRYLCPIENMIVKEFNICPSVALRSKYFAIGLDAIRDISPSTASGILNGTLRVNQEKIRLIGKAPPEKRQSQVAKFLNETNSAKIPKRINKRTKLGKAVIEQVHKDVLMYASGIRRIPSGKQLYSMWADNVERMIISLSNIRKDYKKEVPEMVEEKIIHCISELECLKEAMRNA